MIGQAAIMNPWIFNQAKSLMNEGQYIEPTIEEKINTCITHLKLCCELKGEKYGTLEFRKFYSGYLRNLPDITRFRMELMAYTELEPIVKKLGDFKKRSIEIGISERKKKELEIN